ncbi:MAG: peroxiredoxin [Terrimicrobiaceae bacterium]|nr:peroxiredoxin [Terrimicrobiaceae bacterium]
MERVELLPGMDAPDFEAVAVGGAYGPEGATVRLSGLRGAAVVLYFYPKDDTPGCTTQACDMRDRWSRLLRPDTAFFGVSVDSVASHRKFIEKYGLPFPLISDEAQSIVRAYGVWVEKNLYAKKFMGTERTTFVIRPDGRIKSVFRRVKPAEHTDILLEDLANFEP